MVINETIGLFPKINQNAASGQSCETQVIYTSNSDYLQMLTEIHCNEELPSFYVVMFSVQN